MNIENYTTYPSKMDAQQKHLYDNHEFMAGYESLGNGEYKLYVEALSVPSRILPSFTYNFIHIHPYPSLKAAQQAYHEITERLLEETNYVDKSSGVSN